MIHVIGNNIFIQTHSGNVIKIELRNKEGVSSASYEGKTQSAPPVEPWRNILRQLSHN